MMKCILLLTSFGVYAGRAQDLPGKLQLSIAGGYQQENLRWSIAGNANGQNPNILSELRWENVGGPVAATKMRFILFDHWQLEGEYEHTFFSSGKVFDTDYGGNDRTNAVYAAQFDASKGGADYWRAGLAALTSRVANHGPLHHSRHPKLLRRTFNIPRRVRCPEILAGAQDVGED